MTHDEPNSNQRKVIMTGYNFRGRDDVTDEIIN